MTAGAASANAIIYQDSFTGSATTSLNGSAPTIDNGPSATWTADSVWSDSGYANSGTNARFSAYLAFTPTAGHIYTLSAGMDVTKMTDPTDTGQGDYWFALGFMTTPTTTEGWDATGGPASPWVLNGLYSPTGGTGGTNNTNGASWEGPGLVGGFGFGNPYITSGVNNYRIVLNTGGSSWSYQVFLTNSTYTNLAVGSGTFTTNPAITDVGIQDGKGAGYVSNFELTTSPVPEPASLGLAGVGALGLLMLKRRRNTV